MTRAAVDEGERAEFVRAWNASGVTCIFQNCGEESNDPLRLIKRLARFTYLTDHLRGVLRRAVTPEDVERSHRDGVGCLYFTGNGVPLTQQWNSVEDELRYVRIFFQLGIRMMHVTYNRRNRLGDGCAEVANGGLSDFGRAAVGEMNRVGVIVDVAHSGWQTSLDAARESKKPMVASHTTCGGIFPHIRSKPDRVMRAIADTGGYVGICCIPRFLRRTGDIRALLDHVDYGGQDDRRRPCRDRHRHSVPFDTLGGGIPQGSPTRTYPNAIRRSLAGGRLRRDSGHDPQSGLDELADVHRWNGSARAFGRDDPQDSRRKRAAGRAGSAFVSREGGSKAEPAIVRRTTLRLSVRPLASRIRFPQGAETVRDGYRQLGHASRRCSDQYRS